VWILVIKRQNPELKPFEALRQMPSAAIQFSKKLVKKLIPKKTKDPIETESAGADDFDAENKSVATSENDSPIDETESKNDNDEVDVENPEGDGESQVDDMLDDTLDAGDDDAEADPESENADIGNPLADLDDEEVTSPQLWTKSKRELQDIVDRSVHATPQEREDLVESL